MIYSFDLFDTLITRKVLRPKDIFRLLENQIKDLNIIDTMVDFYTLRISAEKQAREKSRFEEITMVEIYDELNSHLKLSQSNLEIVIELEYKIEFENLIVIKPQLEKFLKLKNKIIITDIYFERKFIEKVLVEILKLKEFSIYISSELRKTKKTGSLFKYVLDDLKISNKDLLHTGDNNTSDFKIPQSLGIKSIFYNESHLTEIENKITISNEDLSKYFGCAKNIRLNNIPNNPILKDVSASVIAPTLFLYVFELLEKASKEKINKLYFLARDGQVLLDIARIIQKKYFKEIECKYLYASRKAWHLASICDDFDDYTFEWLFYKAEKLTFYKIFDRLECEWNKYEDFFKKNGILKNIYEYLDDEEISKVKKLLKENVELKSEVFIKAKMRRELLVEYLKQEEFFDKNKVGIVDIGWNGRLQYSLSKAIRFEKKELEIHGFYFNLLKNLKYSNKDYLYKFTEKNINFSIPVFETFVYATHGTLLGYKKLNEKIKPILTEKINTSLVEWGLIEQQEIIKLFSNEIINNDIKFDNEVIKKQIFINLENFFKNPSMEIAILYSTVMHDDDPTASNLASLVPKISLYDFLQMRLLKKSRFEVIWWNASLVLYLPKVNKILEYIRKIKKRLV